MRKETKEFLEYLNVAAESAAGGRINALSTTRWLISLGNQKIKKIVSDPIWNKYPSFCCYSTNRVSKGLNRFGPEISSIVRYLIAFNSGTINNILIKESVGLIANFAMHYLFGKAKIDLAKRAVGMVDQRARKKATKIIPAGQLTKVMLKEGDCEIVYNIINRVGIENINENDRLLVLEKLLKSKRKGYKIKSIVTKIASSFDGEILKSFLTTSLISDCDDLLYINHFSESLLQKINNAELLFFMDTISQSKGLPKVVSQARISGV